jgi:adenylate cyclase
VSASAHILVVDDLERNARLLVDLLSLAGYRTSAVHSGEAALRAVAADPPDLILLDVMMPGLSGYDVCRAIKADPALGILPVVLVTALDPATERIKGLEVGADDFLTKPIHQAELMARVRSLLRVKTLYDEVQRQRRELATWNGLLEQRVAEGVAQIERMGRLKRFFAPSLVNAILAGDTDDPLASHRREIVVVFLDLHGFTAYNETASVADVMSALREYHAAMGALIVEHEGTLERFTGDGIMVFFNDPVPMPDAPARAMRMALAMQSAMRNLAVEWRERGCTMQLGIGIARGVATIGRIGFAGRVDYGAIGSVTNLAARLCSETKDGEILMASEVAAALDPGVPIESAGEFKLKGFRQPVAVWRAVMQ